MIDAYAANPGPVSLIHHDEPVVLDALEQAVWTRRRTATT